VIYFDTNVVIYGLELVRDDEHLVQTAKAYFDNSVNNQEIVLSFLTIAEVSFVLAKLKVDFQILDRTLQFLSGYAQEILIDSDMITAFLDVAKKTRQYRHSFDLLHLEIARRLHCQKMVTFDRDLKKVQPEYHDIIIETLR
jgi:predicted nucleic acid-binding protein